MLTQYDIITKRKYWRLEIVTQVYSQEIGINVTSVNVLEYSVMHLSIDFKVSPQNFKLHMS